MPKINEAKLYNLGPSYFNMVNRTNDGPKITPMIKFIDVIFDRKKYKIGQDKLNESLSQGYRIQREYQTASGVVFSLTKGITFSEEITGQKFVEEYSESSNLGGPQ